MRRTDLLGMNLWAHRAMTERLRAMSPEERFQLAVELSELGRQIHIAAMRQLAADKAKQQLQ